MQLYNKLSNEERATLIKKANEKRLTLSFYKYHRIKNTTGGLDRQKKVATPKRLIFRKFRVTVS